MTWHRPEDPQRLWSHDRLHYPEQVTPLEFSLIELGVDAGITKAARAYDIPITVHDRHINGYLYIAIEAYGADAAGGRSRAQGLPEKLLETMWRLRETWGSAWLPEVQAHLGWWEGFERATATRTALHEHLCEGLLRWQRVWEVHFLLLLPSTLAMSELADLYSDLFGEDDRFAPYVLLGGFATKTLESTLSLWELSRRALGMPTVLRALMESAPGDVMHHLGEGAEGRRFLGRLGEYLAVHGQRADKLSLRHPYWVEDPAPVIDSLRNYVQQPDRDLAAEAREVGRKREERAAQFHARLRQYPRKVRDHAQLLLGAAQAGAFLAGEHGYWIDYKASYQMRQVLVAIGKRLRSDGVLAHEEDLFYLHMDELQGLIAGGDGARLTPSTLRDHIAARQAHADRFADVTPPPRLGSLPDGAASAAESQDLLTRMLHRVEGGGPPMAAEPNCIVGCAGSPGVARGQVRIVRRLAEASKVQPGDILVAETTAPPWTPLFASLGGLVTEIGGILSHSAVVARELGLPAVVGASLATRALRDGQVVEVDGTRGIVRLIDEAPEAE